MSQSGGASAFGLFVSSVEGKPVMRFGSKVLIGAERDPDQPRKIRYNTKAIVAIPVDEAHRYGREYARLIADEELVAHTADEWTRQQDQIRGVGAPREKLRRDNVPDHQLAKEQPHAGEGGRE
jgi:hypothetical protein